MNEGQRINLNDGTIIEDGNAGESDGYLWLYMTGYTMRQAADMFLEQPGKTGRITFQYGEMEDVYEGYTNCVTLMIDIDGYLSVCMKMGG